MGVTPEDDAPAVHLLPGTRRSQPEGAIRDRFLGCLLGGAVGDALGAPVEFMTRTEIRRQFGPGGITRFAPAYGRLGAITDDTQMTLFTAEGLLRSGVRHGFQGIRSDREVMAHAYLRWLRTQGETTPAFLPDSEPGWLIAQEALHHQRGPGTTCLSALRAMPSLGVPAINDSKGCGGVMRAAPAGLFAWHFGGPKAAPEAFDLGRELAALTHGHPTGALTAGVLAVLILALADGASLPEGLTTAKACLCRKRHHEETLAALVDAETLAATAVPPEAAIARLGEGWVAEEALAIAVYCALAAKCFEQGVVWAVNHDGDSDSTGAIAGNLLGTQYGVGAIPKAWLEPLELRDVITEIALDLQDFPQWALGECSGNQGRNETVWRKYPGC